MESLNKKMFLILGVFFVGKNNGPGVYKVNFSGTISFGCGLPDGTLEDLYGSSMILRARATSSKKFFSFTKEYANKEKNSFEYHFFRKENNFWAGYWRLSGSGSVHDKGLAQCVLVPYPKGYMEPIETIKFLSQRGMKESEIPLFERFALNDVLKRM